jgi:hypothetical protein
LSPCCPTPPPGILTAASGKKPEPGFARSPRGGRTHQMLVRYWSGL